MGGNRAPGDSISLGPSAPSGPPQMNQQNVSVMSIGSNADDDDAKLNIITENEQFSAVFTTPGRTLSGEGDLYTGQKTENVVYQIVKINRYVFFFEW